MVDVRWRGLTSRPKRGKVGHTFDDAVILKTADSWCRRKTTLVNTNQDDDDDDVRCRRRTTLVNTNQDDDYDNDLWRSWRVLLCQ